MYYDIIRCVDTEIRLETLEEAQTEADSMALQCTEGTNGLGTVIEQQATAGSIANTFTALVFCDVSVARFVASSDNVVRACDASCTEEIEQVSVCVNGVVGETGCIGDPSQVFERRCTTGSDAAGLCPTPNMVPMTTLLLEEEPCPAPFSRSSSAASECEFTGSFSTFEEALAQVEVLETICNEDPSLDTVLRSNVVLLSISRQEPSDSEFLLFAGRSALSSLGRKSAVLII